MNFTINFESTIAMSHLFVVRIDTDRDEIVFQNDEYVITGLVCQHFQSYGILWKCYSLYPADDFVFGLTSTPREFAEFVKVCENDGIYISILDTVKIG